MKLFFASPKTMCLLLPIDTLLRINPMFANASFIRKTSSYQQRHASSNETVHNNMTSPEGSLTNIDTADEKGNDHTLSDHLPATGLPKPNNNATFPTTQPTDCGDRKWYIYQNDNGDINFYKEISLGRCVSKHLKVLTFDALSVVGLYFYFDEFQHPGLDPPKNLGE